MKIETRIIKYQGIFKQNIKPKCQIKWEEQYGGNIDDNAKTNKMFHPFMITTYTPPTFFIFKNFPLFSFPVQVYFKKLLALNNFRFLYCFFLFS
jgi:hypothetical protein